MVQKIGAREIADSLHAAGAKLLACGLDRLLRTYGDVFYSGSYYLNLMAWADIDVLLPLDPSQDYLSRFLDLGPRLASVCEVISLRFKNHVRYPEVTLPQGLYWGVRAESELSLPWKLDIWALPSAAIDANRRELDRLKAKLTPQNRARILEIKQALLTPDGRTPVFSGYHTYCAVLDHGLGTVEAVKDYLMSKGVDVLPSRKWTGDAGG